MLNPLGPLDPTDPWDWSDMAVCSLIPKEEEYPV